MRGTRSGQGAPTLSIIPSHVSTLDVTRSDPLGGVFVFSSSFLPLRIRGGPRPLPPTLALGVRAVYPGAIAGGASEEDRQGSKAP